MIIYTSYILIVYILIATLFTIFTLLTAHFYFFAIVGLFKKKSFPETDNKLKYGIIIPARNEASVVGNLIESIQKNNYPQDKLHIFVIAHNCQDNTAVIAKEHGATVYEYNNPEENTMGYAFKHLFTKIKEDYGTENYDGFFLFNADNVLDLNYFNKMNDAFVYYDKKNVITSYRNSKNFGYNLLSSLYGLYFTNGCRFECRGRSALGFSTRVQGTGYVINSDIVKDGWKYVTLTEDWEFTVDQIIKNTPIIYCDDAMFYDEQPIGFKVMWRQRVRWSKGHLLVFYYRIKDLLSQLSRTDKEITTKQKINLYDITINILPISLIGIVIYLLQFILFLFSPLFGVSIVQTFSDWIQFSFKFMPIFAGLSYLLMVASAVIIYVIENKKIPKMRLSLKIASCIVWPFFLALNIFTEIVAFFSKNLTWKTIPHQDTTKFDDLNSKIEE